MSLDFGVLGPLQVSVDRPASAVGHSEAARGARAASDQSQPPGVEGRDHRCDMGRSAHADATHNLHVYVANLRKIFGSAGVDPRNVLASARPGYQLNVPELSCDLGRFATEKAAGVQAAAAGRFGQASDRLSAALAQWRGPVLDDLREFRFAETFATALVEDKLVAKSCAWKLKLPAGDGASVISQLEALVAEHPYREPLWAQLITAYYVAERQTDALAAYRRLRSTLSEELGIDPGPTLRDPAPADPAPRAVGRPTRSRRATHPKSSPCSNFTRRLPVRQRRTGRSSVTPRAAATRWRRWPPGSGAATTTPSCSTTPG